MVCKYFEAQADTRKRTRSIADADKPARRDIPVFEIILVLVFIKFGHNHFSFSFRSTGQSSFCLRDIVGLSAVYATGYGNVAGWMSHAGIVSKRLNLS